MQPHTFDLFGHVIVTHQDVNAWLLAVPKISPDSPRAAYYVRWYDVIGKIERAKIAGTFEETIRPRTLAAESALWWDRMCWR